jgi:hypothetical protein
MSEQTKKMILELLNNYHEAKVISLVAKEFNMNYIDAFYTVRAVSNG